METLIILLKENMGGQEEVARLAMDRRVIVIVPAQQVLLTSARLPKMNPSRLMQALPFALEDEVIDEVETLHFVAGAKQADENLPVAIVSKEKMQAWLNQLQDMKVQPDVLMPATFALPFEVNNWVIALHEMAIVRMSEYQGFACESNNLNEFLQIALNTSQNIPNEIHIYNYTQHAVASTLSLPVKIREDFHEEKQFEKDIADNALKHPYINLLQGVYKSRKSRFPEIQKSGKTASYLVAAFMGLLILYPLISWFILESRASRLDTQIAEIYKRNFPHSSSMVAPRLRMEEKLKQINGSSENRLLILLAYLGDGMKNIPGIHLKRLNYQQGKLNLELSASSSEDFSAFSEFLMNSGLKLKQENVNLLGTEVSAMVTVE